MQCELDCEWCEQLETCQKRAAVEQRELNSEWLEERQAAADEVCASCGCHPDVQRRIAYLERRLARAERWQADLSAFIVRKAEGIE